MSTLSRADRHTLALLLGCAMAGVAVVQVRASTSSARAAATIIPSGLEVSVVRAVPVETVAMVGDVLQPISLMETSVGSLVIRLAQGVPAAAPSVTTGTTTGTRTAEQGGEHGAVVEAGAAPSTQNGRSGQGVLSGDLAVAVSVPATPRGGSGAPGAEPLNVTVEFN